MHRFALLLFILGLGQSIYAASIFQFPDLTRRLPERTTSPGCAYKGDRYEHGESVPTPEPCLNCTCIRAVLVCYLRVCPTSSAPPPGCFAAREVGECCPSLVCGGPDLSRPSNKSDSSPDLRPTFQPIQEETIVDDSSTTIDYPSDTSPPIHDSHADTTVSAEDQETIASSTIEGTSAENTETFNSPTYEVSTVSDSTFHTTLTEDDSLVYITSTQEPTHDYDINFFNDIPGGCVVNGTLYGDGSAMLSSTFCEYCFCIRGKSTCIKPKCHLAIEGCIPHYDTHYSCCPSRYDCSQRTTLSESSSASTETIMTSTLPETTESAGDLSDCIVEGTIYHQGQVVPDRQSCHNCYCSDSSVICEKIKCSPPIEGCQPIIPEGHCCPISYRCDYQGGHSGSSNIKGSNVNDNETTADNKGTDIKSVKNYYISNNANVRLKADNDQESIALLHNVIPIHRRLDENTYYEQNSTAKDIDETSPVYIDYGISTASDGDVDSAPDRIRENDKTLNIELSQSTQTPLDASEEEMVSEILRTLHQTTALKEEPTSVETVSIGSPEVHTLSIQKLFDQYFSRHQINASKPTDEISKEPKRNNSKQPSSIVEIYDSETDTPDSTITTISTTKMNTVPETSKTDIMSLDTSLVTSSHNEPMNVKASTTEQTSDITHVTNYDEDSSFYNQDMSKNGATSTDFPDTEIQNPEQFHTRTDTQPTYPEFATTRRNNEYDENINMHSTLTAFTSNEDLSDQDFIETTLAEIFNAGSHLYSEKFGTQEETLSTYPDESNRHVHSETPKQTYSTLPDYSTKHSLIEELQVKTESRPVVFIYDTTRDVHTDVPTKHSQTQTPSSLHDTEKHYFDDEPQTNTETQATPLVYDNTKHEFTDESIKQTDTHSTPTVYASTKNLNREELTKQTEIDLTSTVYTSTKNINNEDQTETQPILVDFSNNNEHSDHLKEETDSQSTSSTYINNSNSNEKHAHTDSEPRYTTTVEVTKNKDFVKDAEIQQTSPAFTSTRYPSIEETKKLADTNPTGKTLLTTEISNGELNKVTHTTSPTFLPTTHEEQIVREKHFTTVNVPLEETSTQNSLTTESIKLSTRINSKLPSFNYIEDANEKINTSGYPRHPLLTDSVVNVYLPPEGRDSVAGGGDDFTNVGSVYIGAPLSVGGTDSRKDADVGKPKITQSGGVIFMDPKYTDIDTKTNLELQGKVGIDTASAVIQNQTSAEKDSGNNERKKGPRIQDMNQSSAGQGYKIIPFVAEDAIRGQFGKLNNTFVVQQGSTEALPDMVSDFCFIKGRIYMNGEMIGKPDPCELCRCFYGRELCQIQRCPTPPDCIPEKVPGFCCPRFTCGNNTTSGEQINREKDIKRTSFVQLPDVLTSTTRKPDILERIPPTTEKQEVKFGIRVRVRPTQSPQVKSTEHTTERKILLEKTTTIKPEIRTLPGKPSPSTITSTTSKKPNMVRPVTSKIPEMKRTTTTTTSTTTTTTHSPLFPDPWGLLKVSGCNIYGKFFNINDQVEILSGPCSHCICTTNGVECNDIC